MNQNCNICGKIHNSGDCAIIKITNYVCDNVIPSRAKLSLPNFLQLQLLTDGSYTIITKQHIDKGTKFGPIVAKKVNEINPSIDFPLKIFLQQENNNIVDYYLDTTNENECNWLIFVCAAEFLEDQNLICFQEDNDIYYVSIKDIEPNQTLKVWYSPYYAKKMNKNLLVSSALIKYNDFDLESTILLKDIDLNSLVKKQQNIVEKKQWSCKFCNKVDNDIVSFAKHLIVHYRLQLKKMCDICKQTFNSKKNLENHLKIVHCSENSPTNNDQITNLLSLSSTTSLSSLSPLKSTTKDQSVGGPLLNDLFTDSTDLQQFDIDTAISNNQNLLDDDIENLLLTDVENFQHFDFNLIDEKQQQQQQQEQEKQQKQQQQQQEQEQEKQQEEEKQNKSNDNQQEYECDICLKKFKKINLLLIHLKQHTGEYLCTKCMKIFCRKENLTTHICNCEKFYKCDLCNDKTFLQKKYLKRHISIKHKLLFFCNLCKKNYYSKSELSQHNCRYISNLFRKKFVCTICDKVFYRQISLKKHLKTHLAKNNKQRDLDRTSTICEICGALLENKNSLYLHVKKHKEPNYTCKICSKKFHRIDSLRTHEKSHTIIPKYPCNLCCMTFDRPSLLKEHMDFHNGKLVTCQYCQAQFNQRCTLNKHIKSKHKNAQLQLEYFSCPVCDRLIKFKSSLLRHVRTLHPNDYKNVDLSNVKSKIISNNTYKNTNVVVGEIEKKQDDVVIENENNGGDNNKKEVCLSIPDLNEKEQEITLDNNAYILDNGTIIQPQSNSENVIIYVLDQPFQCDQIN